MAAPEIPLDICRRVQQLKDGGLTWAELAERMRRERPEAFGHLDLSQTRTRCRNAFDKARLVGGEAGPGPAPERPAAGACAGSLPKVPQADRLMEALQKGGTVEELAGSMQASPRVVEAMIQDARDAGYNVQAHGGGGYRISRILPPTSNWQARPWGGERLLRFGLVSDTHIGAVDTQLTLLHHLYDYFEREGITDVYHAGDLTDGEKMRPGHEYELYMHGADAQAAHTMKVYPRRKGIITRFITGNHDYAFIRTIGLDIGRQVAAQREDMEYLGYMHATVQLSPGCTLELRHPQDGSAYALSYKVQKMIEAMAGGEKPSILAVGHYHKRGYFEYRSIHAVMVPTTQGQTNFMRGKGLSAHLGGVIIELKLRDDGVISEFVPRFIPFYAATREDYKQWL